MQQLIVRYDSTQDLELLLLLLDKLHFVYEQPVLEQKKPIKKEAQKAVKKAPAPGSRASRFRGKLSAETADALQKYVEQSRNEWERTF